MLAEALLVQEVEMALDGRPVAHRSDGKRASYVTACGLPTDPHNLHVEGGEGITYVWYIDVSRRTAESGGGVGESHQLCPVCLRGWRFEDADSRG